MPVPQPTRRPAAAPAQPQQPQLPEAPSESASEIEDPFAQQDAEAAAGVGDDEDLSGEEFDISDVEEVAGREIIPNGTYPGRIDRCEYKTSSKGNRMFAIQWLLKMPDQEEYTFRVFQHPTLSAKDIGRTKHLVNILLNGQVDWSHFKGVEIAERLISTEGRVRVRKQTNTEYGDSMSVSQVLPAAEALGGFAS